MGDFVLVLKGKLFGLQQTVKFLIRGVYAAVDEALQHLPCSALVAEEHLVWAGEDLPLVHIERNQTEDRLLYFHHEQLVFLPCDPSKLVNRQVYSDSL